MLRIIGPSRATVAALRPCPRPVIPASRSTWLDALTDGHLTTDAELLFEEQEKAVVSAAARGDATELRLAANNLATSTASFARDLRLISLLEPGGHLAQRLHDSMLRLSVQILSLPTGAGGIGETADQRAETESALDQLRSDALDFTEDPFLAIFDAPHRELCDARGVPTTTRVLGRHYGQYGKLERRVRPIVNAVLPNAGLTLENAIEVVMGLIGAPRFLPASRATFEVIELAESEIARQGVAWARPLLEVKRRVGRSVANHQATLRSHQTLQAASSTAERAQLLLDLYRRMIEGQLRPSIWSHLRLHGAGGQRMPETSALRDQLLSIGTPAMLDSARAILPAVRNAAAHEDFMWDDKNRRLLVGDADVSIEDLEQATELAYSIVVGVECGWVCARDAFPELARFLDSEDPTFGHPVLAEKHAITFFGANGFRVRSYLHEDGIFSVSLEEWPNHLINPGFQALMWAARTLPPDTERFQIRLGSGEVLAAEVSRSALDATFIVWMRARGLFDAMPMTAFLPANTYARLLVESPEVAVKAVAWQSVNGVLHAYEDLQGTEPPSQRKAYLEKHFYVTVAALGYTMPLMPQDSIQLLRDVLKLIDDAWEEEQKGPRDRVEILARNAERRIRKLHRALPIPSILPTLDPRPLEP
jgi:hypothetical protein